MWFLYSIGVMFFLLVKSLMKLDLLLNPQS